jgi:CheY-like chemotaxis protein
MGSAHSETTGPVSEVVVLHVDDNPEMVSLSETLLEQEDDRFTVVPETNPVRAVEWVENRSVDCIVSDYQMPEMNGAEFYEAVQRVDPSLPFVLFTQKETPARTELCSHQLDGYVQKSGNPQQYAELASRILETVSVSVSG